MRLIVVFSLRFPILQDTEWFFLRLESGEPRQEPVAAGMRAVQVTAEAAAGGKASCWSGFSAGLLQNGVGFGAGWRGKVFSCRIEFPAWQQARRGWTLVIPLMDYRENAGK